MTDKWEEKYKAGKECNTAPFDEVVSFVYKFKPDKPHRDIKILELGCGCGNNINFLALHGFQTFGIERAPTAVSIAKRGFSKISQGSFTDLPWEDGIFDLVIDRASLTFAAPDDMQLSIDESFRVLSPGGRMFFTPYAWGEQNNAYFYDYSGADSFFHSSKWRILQAHKTEAFDYINNKLIESHWRFVYEKTP